MVVDALVNARLVDLRLGSAAVALGALGDALRGGVDLGLVGRGHLLRGPY